MRLVVFLAQIAKMNFEKYFHKTTARDIYYISEFVEAS